MGICTAASNKVEDEENIDLIPTNKQSKKRPKIYDKYNEKEFYLLQKMFKDLAVRSPNDTVSKQTFLEYFSLPGILGDRLFAIFDIKHTEVIDFEEFLIGYARYNQGSLRDKIAMLFEMYDMNGEEQVNRDELSLILYTVITPTQTIFDTSNSKSETHLQLQSMAGIKSVSTVAKQNVLKIINEAFEHYDTNKDGMLSEQQFSNWVKHNPSTLRLLENALSKHKWLRPGSTPRECSCSVPLSPQSSEMSFESEVDKSGPLYKTESGNLVKRYYAIHDKLLYTFMKESDIDPVNVVFIVGWYIQKTNDAYQSQGYYGIELTSPTIDDWKDGFDKNDKKRKRKTEEILYCASRNDRSVWVKSLQTAAATLSIDAFYSVNYEKLLGKSHFSVVYEGTDLQSTEKYAIKIVEKCNIDDEQRLNLRNEIAIMGLVNHPSIIRLHNVFVDTQRMYMVMTLCKFGNFFQRWKKRRRFEEEIARIIIWKLLDALGYLHALGIVHRDLKPENMLCTSETDDTQIVISDFGLSKFSTPSQLMTMPCGTLCYVAPEVLLGQRYSKKVDLWSVGCIMHLLLRGLLPFDGRLAEEIKHKTVNKALNLSSQKWDSVSGEAKDLIRRLLIKDPNGRVSLSEALKHEWFHQNSANPDCGGNKLELHMDAIPTIHILANHKKNEPRKLTL